MERKGGHLAAAIPLFLSAWSRPPPLPREALRLDLRRASWPPLIDITCLTVLEQFSPQLDIAARASESMGIIEWQGQYRLLLVTYPGIAAPPAVVCVGHCSTSFDEQASRYCDRAELIPFFVRGKRWL